MQQVPGAVKPHFDGRRIGAQQAGDLHDGQSVRLVQQQDGAIVMGQEVQAVLHASAGFFPLGDFLCGRAQRNYRLHSFRGSFVIDGDVRHALAQTIEGNVSGNAVEPAPHGFRIAQCFPMAMRAEKCFLRQIFRFHWILNEPEQIAVNTILVRLEERRCVNGDYADLVFVDLFLDWHKLLMARSPPEFQ